MSTRTSIPQTPERNNDVLEMSRRRQSSERRSQHTIGEVVHRAVETPVRQRSSSSRRTTIGDNQEEWMKMVRSNRVVAANAFTIPLIDTFYNLLTEDGFGQYPGIFREAAQSLDGCMTVYKSRVGRVNENTTKLIVSLREGSRSDDSNDADGADNEDDTGETKKQRKKKRLIDPSDEDSHIVASEKLSIDVKELVTKIDPILLKMSRDFDKRGPESLLQYSVRSNEDGKLILDTEHIDDTEELPHRSRTELPDEQQEQEIDKQAAQLTTIPEEDEDVENNSGHITFSKPRSSTIDDDEESADENDMTLNKIPNENINEIDVDLANVTLSYFAKLNLLDKEVQPLCSLLATAVETPSEGTKDLLIAIREMESADPTNYSMYISSDSINDGLKDGEMEVEQNQFDHDFNNDNFDGIDEQRSFENNDLDLGFGWEQIGSEAGVNDDIDGNDNQDAYGGDSNNYFNELDRTPNTSVVNIPENGMWYSVDFLKQLDQQKSRNWAGPNFWKVKRLVGTKESKEDAKSNNKRTAKLPTLIDFESQDEVPLAELFGTKRRSTLFPLRKYTNEQEFLLPIDMSVKAQSFASLVLKPRASIAGVRGPVQGINDLSMTIDENKQQINLDKENGTSQGSYDGNVSHPYYGDDDVADNYNDNDYATTNFRKASEMFGAAQDGDRPHSRSAKRVDIRLLKNNVWQSISHHIKSEEKEAGLLQVIMDTQPKYSENKASDLSPALYFISLLHLSNEQGLLLQNTPELNDIHIFSGEQDMESPAQK